MADRLAKGRLADLLLRYKAEGRSLDEMSRQLYADHGIEASRQTVANWFKFVPEPTDGEASEASA